MAKTGHRPLPQNEPTPPPGTPVKPVDLLGDDKWALEEWDRIVPLLDEIGLLSKYDAKSIAMYCVALATWFRLSHFLNKHGYSTKGRGGQLKSRPEVRSWVEADRTLRYYVNAFGLTPAARAGMGGVVPPEVLAALKAQKESNAKDHPQPQVAKAAFFGT